MKARNNFPFLRTLIILKIEKLNKIKFSRRKLNLETKN